MNGRILWVGVSFSIIPHIAMILFDGSIAADVDCVLPGSGEMFCSDPRAKHRILQNKGGSEGGAQGTPQPPGSSQAWNFLVRQLKGLFYSAVRLVSVEIDICFQMCFGLNGDLVSSSSDRIIP